jgi:hypothetical protein
MDWVDEMSPVTLFMWLFVAVSVVYVLYNPPSTRHRNEGFKAGTGTAVDPGMAANLNLLRIAFQSLPTTLEIISNSLKEIAINTKPN